MCVEIKKPEIVVPYKIELPLDTQIADANEVLIDCDHDCDKVNKFLDEIEKACQQGKTFGFNIKLQDKTNIKLFKKTKELNKEILINDMIYKAVEIHKNTSDKLEELSDLLKG